MIFGMTSDEFRTIALSFQGAEEGSHMQHPDFRLGGKIFATLGPGETWGMVKMTPGMQQEYMRIAPSAFKPAAGKWGDGGATIVTLADADEGDVRDALESAWRSAPRANRL
ncbi:MAG: MmcQ/YjbR family DNA-binding protein [Pyrinomonadaceae bacterium]